MFSGIRNVLILGFALAFVAKGSTAESITLDEVKEAFGEIKDKLTSIKDNSIVKKVIVYGEVIGHTALAVKSTVNLIQSLMGGPKESKELVFMREQFAIVNTKLDALDYDFENLKNQIDWSVMKVNIGEYERAIKTLQKKFLDYVQAPVSAAPFFLDMFIHNYIRSYSDAATKIYTALAKDSAIFQDNLFKVARQQLKNDLSKVSEFTGYILRIIERGVTVEHAYFTALNKTSSQARLKEEWDQRFKALEGVAKKVENEIINSWRSQFRIDSDEFAVRNAHLSNRDMATRLMEFLYKKYPWRWWFVFVYTFTDNNDKDRYFENCGETFIKSNVGNKVVLVNGLPPNYPQKPNPDWFFRSVPSYLSGFGAYAKLAKEMYNRSPSGCHLYVFKGIFEKKSDPSFWAPGGRFFGKEVKALRSFHDWKPYLMYMLV